MSYIIIIVVFVVIVDIVSILLQPIDHKNIRRRVYDALNVLMAMNIISKEKKEIKWLGLPTNSAQECQHIEVLYILCNIRTYIRSAFYLSRDKKQSRGLVRMLYVKKTQH